LPIALVTGANRGIGLEIAAQLAGRGFHVVMGVRDAAAGTPGADQIRKSGGSADILVLDVADSASIRTAADTFGQTHQQLDVLINNAGIYPDDSATILDVSRERLVECFQTNTFGALQVVQVFLPFMRRADRARVINLSSGYGQWEGLSPDVPSYCLSKLALNGATVLLAEALRADSIAVNSVCPGWVRMEMGGPNATRSIPEGADTPVWLAAEAPMEYTGLFFRDRAVIPW
jgi:NAD(P)-dependent dehydrogenase (short-subunit alcohol dehydrogenase family)